MSAFLGKIHYWLFNKIQLHEKLIDNIVELAASKGKNIQSIVSESHSKYGFPVTGLLEDEIDHSNIHSWLQGKIMSVEARLAYIITELLKSNVLTIEEIGKLFYMNGESLMKELGGLTGAPQDAYNLIFDYMIEGMPCDRVNNVIENTESIIKWETTKDLHGEHWDAVGGNVAHFNDLRDSWIKGFLSASGMAYAYERNEDGTSQIRKV